MSERSVRKEIIKKHSAAIHIQNNITLLQRRAWNVLLYHAYDELPHHERHHVPVKVLIDQLQFDSKNEDYLREALEALVGCKVKWNVLDKDGEWEWGVTTLLAEAKIKGGVCTYAYGPTLRERLYSPTMYAKIDLSIQNQFDSKHAQALWEICVDYLNEVRGAGETPFIPLVTYRELMGIHESQYPRFKEFNRRVVKEPVEEINRVTDFYVEVDYKRESRKVTAVKFKVQREQELPHYDVKQSTLFPDLDDMPVTVKVLKDAGLSAHEAWEIWQHNFDGVDADKRPADIGDNPEAAFTHYVREKVHLLKQRKEQGKIKSDTGFLRQAIKHNYSNPGFAAEEKARREYREANEKKRQRERLEQEKATINEAYSEVYNGICAAIIRESSDALEVMIHAALEESPILRQYCQGRSPEEQYHSSLFVSTAVHRQMEQRYPERFEAVREFQSRLDTVDKKLAALG
jgi:hypothetical protein